jgi:hypothetical protein
MRKFGVLVLLAMFVAACSNQPIYNVEDRAIPATAQQLPLDRIETIIVEAGQSRGWKFNRQGPGHLVASQVQPKFSATVDITFDQRSYRIVYRSSTGFRERPDGTIHEHYNFWIRNLQNDIDTRLANASFAS